MPNSTDNQDYTDNASEKEKDKKSATKNEGANKDENNFSSDDQKGKKVDGDPEKESDKPASV